MIRRVWNFNQVDFYAEGLPDLTKFGADYAADYDDVLLIENIIGDEWKVTIEMESIDRYDRLYDFLNDFKMEGCEFVDFL